MTVRRPSTSATRTIEGLGGQTDASRLNSASKQTRGTRVKRGTIVK